MNIERIDDAIRIMQDAHNLNMATFQNSTWGVKGIVVDSISSLHACGNTACFAGYIALSPMFRAAGGRAGSTGGPMFNDTCDSYAIAYYLDISPDLAFDLVFSSAFYPVSFSKVKPHHVIDKLEAIKRGELV